MRLVINEDTKEASIAGIPDEIWEQFKVNAKVHFPDQKEDAWAAFLSEVILSVGGGTTDSETYFMTDIPRKNHEALGKIFGQAGWKFEQFHTYLLRIAVGPNMLRMINFGTDKIAPGTLIVTGITPEAFRNIEESSKLSVEDIFAAVFNGAAKGHVTFTGTPPTNAEVA